MGGGYRCCRLCAMTRGSHRTGSHQFHRPGTDGLAPTAHMGLDETHLAGGHQRQCDRSSAALDKTGRVAFPKDRGVIAVARQFGVGSGDILGHGGEAWVYAIGRDRVLRILHPGGRVVDILRRQELVDELRQARPAYALPDLLDAGEFDGRAYAVERRLPGHSVSAELGLCDDRTRPRIVESSSRAAQR